MCAYVTYVFQKKTCVYQDGWTPFIEIYFTMKKSLWVSFGFLLFIFGFISLILSLVGLKLSFLTWIDSPGAIFGFIVRILMIVGGVVVVYLSATDWRSQDE